MVGSVTSISSPSFTDRTRPLSALPRLNRLSEGLLGDEQLTIHRIPVVAITQSLRRPKTHWATRYLLLGLADGPHLRGGGAFLDHREVPAAGAPPDIERVGFAGLPIGGGVGLVEGVIELRMVRHEGGRAEIRGRLRHLSRRRDVAVVVGGVAIKWDRGAADVRDPQRLAVVLHLEEE